MMQRSAGIRSTVTAVSLLFLLTAALADEPRLDESKPQRPSQELLEVSPEDALSKGSYSQRQKATLEMWRRRDLSREQVQQAARHPDPEVAGRAKWVLRQWRRGAVPGMPPKISRLLHSNDPAATEELLEYGQFQAAVVAVEESAGSVDLESIQERIGNALVQRFPVYVATALRDDSLPDLLRLVDLVAKTREMAVCRVQLVQHLGLPIDDSTLLPAAAETWSEADRAQATVLVLFVLGRVDEAVDRARLSRDAELLTLARMLAGRWDLIAETAIESAESAEANSREQIRHYSHALIAADRNNDSETYQKALDGLTRDVGVDGEQSLELRWQSLALHGEIEAAVKILTPQSPDVAAELALVGARAEQAIEVLGYPLADVDAKLDTWIDEVILAEGNKTDDTEINDPARRLLMFMRVMIRVGRDDTAWTIASRLSSPIAGVTSNEMRELVLYHLLMAARNDWVVDLAVQPGERSISSRVEGYLTFALPDLHQATFKILMDAVSYLMPGIEFRDRFRVVCDLVAGETPKEFEQPGMFDRLYDRLTAGKRLQREGGRVVVSPRIQLNTDIVALFAKHGQADLATRCLQELSQGGDAESSLELAEGELNRGGTEKASEYLQLLWRQVHGTGASNRNLNADATFAAKALVGQWIIAQRKGDEELAQQYLTQIKVTLCSPSTEMRNEIGQYLAQWGRADLANEAFDVLLPMTAFGSREATEFYDVARSYAMLMREEKANEAARWFDLAIIGILESRFRNRAYVTLPLYVHRIAVEGAIKAGLESKARQHVQRILKLDPIDIDFAERLLPKMSEAGMEALAGETLDKIIDQGKAHMETFTFDATVSNNLAWAAAMNNRRLEEALVLSERAVYLEPDSAVYRDTLAEVLFLLGRVREALHIEECCVLDDPDQWHLHQQIKKYRDLLGEK